LVFYGCRAPAFSGGCDRLFYTNIIKVKTFDKKLDFSPPIKYFYGFAAGAGYGAVKY
jgi:hypothetical protein